MTAPTPKHTAHAAKYNKKKKPWRKKSWLQKQHFPSHNLLRRLLYAVIAAEAICITLTTDRIAPKLTDNLLKQETYITKEHPEESTPPKNTRERGFLLDLKKGILKIWQIEESAETAEPAEATESTEPTKPTEAAEPTTNGTVTQFP